MGVNTSLHMINEDCFSFQTLCIGDMLSPLLSSYLFIYFYLDEKTVKVIISILKGGETFWPFGFYNKI